MTQEEITEANKIIAEFMNEQGHSHKDAYHENWNALMPVVIKIKNLMSSSPIETKYAVLNGSINIALMTASIADVWLAVVNNIKRYNSYHP